MTNISVRHVARVILLDRSKNILLVRYEKSESMDPDRECPLAYWVPPGGALEEGEDHQIAARRELEEESGLTVELGPLIWERKHKLWFRKTLVSQVERYYVANIDEEKPPVENQSSEDIVDIRWWSVEELRKSSDIFFPEEFFNLIVPVVNGELPSIPLQI